MQLLWAVVPIAAAVRPVRISADLIVVESQYLFERPPAVLPVIVVGAEPDHGDVCRIAADSGQGAERVAPEERSYNRGDDCQGDDKEE